VGLGRREDEVQDGRVRISRALLSWPLSVSRYPPDLSTMDTQRTLKLVIEKADKLRGLRFTRYLIDGGSIGFSATAPDGGGFVVQREGPDEEAIDAFVLTLRFFVQDNEPTSLNNIDKLFSGLPLEPARIKAVSGTHHAINDYLDGSSHHFVGGRGLTRREIFEVFLYGGLAHANAEKKTTYDRWANDEIGFLTLQMEFTDILVKLLKAIFWFRQACQQALDILSAHG